jgi:hypothetical protein
MQARSLTAGSFSYGTECRALTSTIAPPVCLCAHPRWQRATLQAEFVSLLCRMASACADLPPITLLLWLLSLVSIGGSRLTAMRNPLTLAISYVFHRENISFTSKNYILKPDAGCSCFVGNRHSSDGGADFDQAWALYNCTVPKRYCGSAKPFGPSYPQAREVRYARTIAQCRTTTISSIRCSTTCSAVLCSSTSCSALLCSALCATLCDVQVGGEGSGLDGLWVAYSINKEDIGVSFVPRSTLYGGG